jgi:hypothetical protein
MGIMPHRSLCMPQASHQHLHATSAFVSHRTSLYSKLLQEYLDINRPVVEFMTKIGSDSATISDATHAWMEIKQHFNALTAHHFSRISVRPREDMKTVCEYLEDRICKGIEDVHWLALFLDPRPSMRAYVQAKKLTGSSEEKTMGNTPELQRAQKSLKHLATSGAIQVC